MLTTMSNRTFLLHAIAKPAEIESPIAITTLMSAGDRSVTSEGAGKRGFNEGQMNGGRAFTVSARINIKI